MVHAGLPPQWSIKEAAIYAAELEGVLRSKKTPRLFLAHVWRWTCTMGTYIKRLEALTIYYQRVYPITVLRPEGTTGTGSQGKTWHTSKRLYAMV